MKTGCQFVKCYVCIFDSLHHVWKCRETRSFVFDMLLRALIDMVKFLIATHDTIYFTFTAFKFA